eukprot:s662_g30.t1
MRICQPSEIANSFTSGASGNRRFSHRASANSGDFVVFSMSQPGVDRILTGVYRLGLGLGTAAMIPSLCLYDVDGGQRVVMLNMLTGVEEKVRGEGTHFKVPWLMQPKWYSIRLRPKLIQTTTGTKDLQMVTIHIRMLFKPQIEGLPTIHRTLGEDYDERVLPSIANEVMKATIAQYNAESLLTQREQDVSNAMSSECRGEFFHLSPVYWTESELARWLECRGLPPCIARAFEEFYWGKDHLVNGLVAVDLRVEEKLGEPGFNMDWLEGLDEDGFLELWAWKSAPVQYHDKLASGLDSIEQMLVAYTKQDGEVDPKFFEDIDIKKLGHRRLFQQWFREQSRKLAAQKNGTLIDRRLAALTCIDNGSRCSYPQKNMLP